jgi:hypothetical protein
MHLVFALGGSFGGTSLGTLVLIGAQDLSFGVVGSA